MFHVKQINLCYANTTKGKRQNAAGGKTMTYKIITENGRIIADNLSEKAADKFWERLNGIWTDYDDNDKEYYIYIEEGEKTL